jgi:hypothetical protein
VVEPQVLRTVAAHPGGAGAALFSARGLDVMLIEAVQFLPLFVVGLWPKKAD